MASYKDRRFWFFTGFGIFVIVILLITLIFLAFSEKKLPDNAVIVDNAILEGEELNEETIEKMAELFSKNPGLDKLPLTVEYYTDDLSNYIKYILTFELDDSERGFRIIMKDYTGEGREMGILKLRDVGLDLTNLQIIYENLTEETLNYRADVI